MNRNTGYTQKENEPVGTYPWPGEVLSVISRLRVGTEHNNNNNNNNDYNNNNNNNNNDNNNNKCAEFKRGLNSKKL